MGEGPLRAGSPLRTAGIVWQLMLSEATYGFLNGVLKLIGCRRSPGSPIPTSPSGPPFSPMSGAAPPSR